MQDKHAWLVERKQGIGGSDVGAILGVNKYKTPFQLWREKTSPEVSSIPDNEFMEWGRKLEPVIADEFALRNHRKLRKIDKIFKHPKIPYLIGSIDRWISPDKTHADKVLRHAGILEIKTVSAHAIREWETKVPLSYYCQLQHYLYVTELKWGAFAILVGGHHYDQFVVMRDDEYLKKQVEILMDFWENHVLTNTPPNYTSADLDGVKSQEKSIHADSVIAKDIEEILSLNTRAKELKERMEELKSGVKVYMGVFDTLELDGEMLATYKTDAPTEKIDVKKFSEEMPTIYKKYLVAKKPTRRLLIKGATDGD